MKKEGIPRQTQLIYVDGYERDVLSGRVCPAWTRDETRFQSLMELLLTVENNASQPPASKETADHPPDTGQRRGRLATFAVRIVFQEHTELQGTIQWLEGKREERFRSVVELTRLLDSALRETVEGKTQKKIFGEESGNA